MATRPTRETGLGVGDAGRRNPSRAKQLLGELPRTAVLPPLVPSSARLRRPFSAHGSCPTRTARVIRQRRGHDAGYA